MEDLARPAWRRYRATRSNHVDMSESTCCFVESTKGRAGLHMSDKVIAGGGNAEPSAQANHDSMADVKARRTLAEEALYRDLVLANLDADSRRQRARTDAGSSLLIELLLGAREVGGIRLLRRRAIARLRRRLHACRGRHWMEQCCLCSELSASQCLMLEVVEARATRRPLLRQGGNRSLSLEQSITYSLPSAKWQTTPPWRDVSSLLSCLLACLLCSIRSNVP